MKTQEYTKSSFYQIGLTAKYLKIYSEQIFKKLFPDMAFEEFIVMEIIRQEGSICQRDLAKLLLRDRANTGRIVNAMVKKGLLKIIIEMRNNRLVKNLMLTAESIKLSDEILRKLTKVFDVFEKEFNDKEEDLLIGLLEKLQNSLKKVVALNI